MAQTDEHGHDPVDIWAAITAIQEDALKALSEGKLRPGMGFSTLEMSRMSATERTMLGQRINGWLVTEPGRAASYKLVWSDKSKTVKVEGIEKVELSHTS